MDMQEQQYNINNVELLKIYYDEWKYRLNCFRKQMFQLVIIIFFTSSLPITVAVFENIKLPKMPLIIFPLTGILLTSVFLWYCLSEAIRISTLDSQIKKIIKENFPEQYAKTTLIPMVNKKFIGILGKRMTIWIPIALALIEVIIAVFMIFLILNHAIIL